MEIHFQMDVSLLPMFSSSEYRILTPLLPADLFGKLKLSLFNRSRSCPQEPLAEIQASIGTEVSCVHWWNKGSSVNLGATSQCQVSISIYSSLDAYQGSQWCCPFLSRLWKTVKLFWKLKHGRTGSFGNVQCLTFIPHTIPLRKRKDHLIIPPNSHENQPGSKMNHSPCSHLPCSVSNVSSKKFFKAFLSPLALVWLYTKTGFLLCRAVKADLCLSKGSVTPVRKNK